MSDFIKIGVTGKDPEIWEKFRNKLLLSINKFLDIVIDDKNQNTIRDEAKEFSSALLEFGKAKLNSPVLENEKIKAEIQLLYGKLEEKRANTRKRNAEAQKTEFENAIVAMKIAVEGIKLILSIEGKENNIIFIQNIDSLISSLGA